MRSRSVPVLLLPLLLATLVACGSDEESASGECSYVETGSAAKDVDLPPSDPVSADGDTMTIATNRGDLEVTLDADSAPCTVSSFVSLAKQGYFDDTSCHRLVPGFVLQCGDPSGTGRGGPGYSFADELTGDETYPAGTLAMANSGRDTNGSQFFIVLDGGESGLTPDYTVFGTVSPAGQEIVEDVAKAGNGPDGVAPADEVVIESVS